MSCILTSWQIDCSPLTYNGWFYKDLQEVGSWLLSLFNALFLNASYLQNFLLAWCPGCGLSSSQKPFAQFAWSKFYIFSDYLLNFLALLSIVVTQFCSDRIICSNATVFGITKRFSLIIHFLSHQLWPWIKGNQLHLIGYLIQFRKSLLSKQSHAIIHPWCHLIHTTLHSFKLFLSHRKKNFNSQWT